MPFSRLPYCKRRANPPGSSNLDRTPVFKYEPRLSCEHRPAADTGWGIDLQRLQNSDFLSNKQIVQYSLCIIKSESS